MEMHFGLFTLLGVTILVLKAIGYLETWSWWWVGLIFLGDIILMAIALTVLYLLSKKD